MTLPVAKWVVCDLCGGTEPTLSADDLSRLHPAGWRRVVVPIVWVQSLLVAAVGPGDMRTAMIDACPACCVHLRAAFVLVQRVCSRRALAGATAPIPPRLALMPAGSTPVQVVGAQRVAAETCRPTPVKRSR